MSSSNCCLQQLFEGLFSHFFSTHRSNYHRQDCQWFLELVNDNLDLSSQSSVSLEGEGGEGSDSESTGCISMGVYKVYLTRILGSTEMSDGSTVSCPALYKQSVCVPALNREIKFLLPVRVTCTRNV